MTSTIAIRPIATLLALAACTLCSAHSGDVYKCTNAQGGIAFQDRPCAGGEIETPIQVAAPPATADASGADTSAAPAPPAPPAQPVANAAENNAPLPSLWLCTRPEDGSQYMSPDGVTQPRMVPAGILGIPSQGLSAANAGGGAGISAPSRKNPANSATQAAITGDYVAVQDQCEHVSREQTCDYLRGQYDKVHEKLRHAFKDEQAVLQPQEDELDKQLDGC